MNFSTELFAKYFSWRDKSTDINKDADGKGTLERFISCLGDDLDIVKSMVDDLLLNTIDTDQALDRFIPFLESEAGFDDINDTLMLGSAMQMRRAILRALPYLYTVKGTRLGYTIPLGYLGLGATLDDTYTGFGFDSPITWDDKDRRLDSYKPDYLPYTLNLTGTLQMTEGLLRAIRSIIIFNQPIDTKLLIINYNGDLMKELTGDYQKDFSDDFLAV